jgi:predicted amidohydrolase
MFLTEIQFVPVEFTDIAEFLRPAGLLVPDLNVLEPNAQPYSVLAIQPCGQLAFNQTFVGNANRAQAIKKFFRFLHDAAAANVDLVLSPEYSCPWKSLEDALAGNLFPGAGKLWALGCESITPHELSALRQRHSDVAWICETPAAAPGKFLDPVCYLLNTQTDTGQDKKVVVIQFKTVPMGGGRMFERNNIISGQRRYYLRNRQVDHVRFYTIICSEALEFEIDHARAVELTMHPSIIFHPQMVDDVRHAAMRKYRADLFHNTCSEHTEVFSLNWAKKLRAADGETGQPAENGQGNSAIFMKSQRFDRSDNAITNNHALGIYYCRWNEHQSDLCVLNYEEYVFNLVNQKVIHVGAAVQARRTGPAVRELKKWNAANESWDVAVQADDGFQSFCESYETPHLAPCLVENATPVDRERLLTLSAGTLDPVPDWHSVERMQSFICEADERSKRLTFVQDTCPATRDFRNDHIVRFIELQTRVLANEATFPPNIVDLRGNYSIVCPAAATRFRFNLLNRQNNQNGATVIFLGVKPRSEAKEFYQRLRRGWGERDGKMREELVRRIVVAYLDADGTLRMEHPGLGSFTDDSETPSSISSAE